jgi:hypothetical protein
MDGDWRLAEADGLALSHARLRGGGGRAATGATRFDPTGIVVLTVRAPLPTETPPPPSIRPADVISAFSHDTGQHQAPPRWSWREAHFPVASKRCSLLARHLGMAFPMPRVPRRGRLQVGMAVMSPGAEVATQCRAIAAALREAGCDVHLLVFEASTIRQDGDRPSPFASVGIFAGGLATSAPDLADRMLGFLAGLDVAINFDVVPLHAVASRLRDQGLLYASHVDHIDRTPFGRPCGHAALVASYEHVQDLIVASSPEIAGALHAAGVPFEKMLIVPAAYLGEAGDGSTSGPRFDRGERRDGRLSAATFGPLDRRTLERLPALIRRSKVRSIPLDWHFVVTDGTSGAVDVASIEQLRQLGVTIHRLPDLPEPRRSLWLAIDVVLVPGAEDGGAMLAAEAEAAGCITLCASAAREDAALDALAALATDRPRREELARGSCEDARGKSWQAACEPLVGRLRDWFAEKLNG